MLKKDKKLIRKISFSVILIVLCILFFEISVRLIFGKHLFYEVDKELYWKLKPSQKGYQTLGFPKATINTNGFRGPEIDINKENILLLGNSYTFGEGVKDTETFAYIIQKKLSEKDFNYNVINMGVPGWGLFQEQIALERNFDTYKPRIIVLTLIKDNLRRQKFKDENLEQKYLKKQRIRYIFKNFALISFLNQLGNKVFYSYLFRSDQNYIKNNNLTKLWPSQKVILDEISTYSSNHNRPLILVIYPSKAGDFHNFKRLIREFSSEKNIILIDDLDLYFRKIPTETLVIKGDGHPSPIAHEIVGNRIYDKLINEGLLFSSPSAVTLPTDM